MVKKKLLTSSIGSLEDGILSIHYKTWWLKWNKSNQLDFFEVFALSVMLNCLKMPIQGRNNDDRRDGAQSSPIYIYFIHLDLYHQHWTWLPLLTFPFLAQHLYKFLVRLCLNTKRFFLYRDIKDFSGNRFSGILYLLPAQIGLENEYRKKNSFL